MRSAAEPPPPALAATAKTTNQPQRDSHTTTTKRSAAAAAAEVPMPLDSAVAWVKGGSRYVGSWVGVPATTATPARTATAGVRTSAIWGAQRGQHVAPV